MPYGEPGEPVNALDTQFPADVRPVILHGTGADVEPVCDLPAGEEFAHQRQHPAFRRGEEGEFLLFFRRAGCRSEPDAGTDVGGMVQYGVQAAIELVGSVGLEKETHRTQGERLCQGMAVIGSGEDDHLHPGPEAGELGQDVETVPAGHAEIQEGEIGSTLPQQCQRLAAIAGFCHLSDAGVLLQKGNESFPEDRMIIHHERVKRIHSVDPGGRPSGAYARAAARWNRLRGSSTGRSACGHDE